MKLGGKIVQGVVGFDEGQEVNKMFRAGGDLRAANNSPNTRTDRGGNPKVGAEEPFTEGDPEESVEEEDPLPGFIIILKHFLLKVP